MKGKNQSFISNRRTNFYHSANNSLSPPCCQLRKQNSPTPNNSSYINPTVPNSSKKILFNNEQLQSSIKHNLFTTISAQVSPRNTQIYRNIKNDFNQNISNDHSYKQNKKDTKKVSLRQVQNRIQQKSRQTIQNPMKNNQYSFVRDISPENYINNVRSINTGLQLTNIKNRQRVNIPSFIVKCHQNKFRDLNTKTQCNKAQKNVHQINNSRETSIKRFQNQHNSSQKLMPKNFNIKIEQVCRQNPNKIKINKNVEISALPLNVIQRYANPKQKIHEQVYLKQNNRPSITQKSTTANFNSSRSSTVQRISECNRQLSIQKSQNGLSENRNSSLQHNSGTQIRKVISPWRNLAQRQSFGERIFTYRNEPKSYQNHTLNSFYNPKQGNYSHRQHTQIRNQSPPPLIASHPFNNITLPISPQRKIVCQQKKVKQPEFKLFFPWDFKKIKQIARGKFGIINLVKHKQTGFICALKIINKKLAKQEKVEHQISKEIKIHYQISKQVKNSLQFTKSSRHFISLYGYFQDYENFYILMQYATTGTLYDRIKQKGKLEQSQVAPIIKSVSQGIKYLHNLKFIHRDIKPQNIMLQFGVPKICDFGWASRVLQKDNFLRKSLAGTPLYYSPEMVKQQQYGRQVDIWALGVLTYQSLQGRIPWSIFSQADLKQIVNKDIPFPDFLDFTESSKDFIIKTLCKDPKKRLTAQQVLSHAFLSLRYEPWLTKNISSARKVSADNYDYDIFVFMKQNF